MSDPQLLLEGCSMKPEQLWGARSLIPSLNASLTKVLYHLSLRIPTKNICTALRIRRGLWILQKGDAQMDQKIRGKLLDCRRLSLLVKREREKRELGPRIWMLCILVTADDPQRSNTVYSLQVQFRDFTSISKLPGREIWINEFIQILGSYI